METKFLHALSNHLDSISSPSLSLGLEHEFFILNEQGSLANFIQSQRFLEIFSRIAHNSLCHKTNGYITAVEFLIENKIHILKYEYPPHLLEVASSPFLSLAEAKLHLDQIFELISNCAYQSGVNDKHIPYWSGALHKISTEINPAQEELEKNREFIAKSKGITNYEVCRFPARIASTQIHVGGFNWLKNECLLQNIYQDEIDTYLYSCKNAGVIDHSERWEGYYALFSGYELFGFPKFNTFKDCMNFKFNTLTSPLKDYNELEAVRDLQLIKPRTFGTLEFRSSPAQGSPKSILDLISRRQKQVEEAITNNQNNTTRTTPLQLREQWSSVFTSKGKTIIQDYAPEKEQRTEEGAA